MPNTLLLKLPVASCLEALRSGADRKTTIALAARLNLRQTLMALLKLESAGLVTTQTRRKWQITPRGKRAKIAIVSPTRSPGRKPATARAPGPAALRLLALLDRPRRGADLATMLNVTRQRIHQLVVALSAFDRIRSADATYPLFVVARKDDKSVILSQSQERILSAFPASDATTLSKIAQATSIHIAKVKALAGAMRESGLIETAGATNRFTLYRLTTAGSSHWQRSTTAPQADIPPPPFRSDRVRDVLTCLQTRGPIRTRDIGRALDIAQPSINALMQYLKRRGAVITAADTHHAPYILTPNGHEMLTAMLRHDARPTGTHFK